MNALKRFADYFFKEPFSALKNKNSLTEKGEWLAWRPIFIFAIIFSLFGLIFLARDAGISGDEFFHVFHSKDVINYYKTGGADKAAATPTASNNLPYYSQSPDTFIHLIINAFNIDDYMPYRHLLCNILGWLGILYAALLARRIGGWRAAVFTCVLLFLSPRFLGHSFNNLKDIPFASACIMSIYYIVKFLDNLPKIKISTAVMLCLSIAFATSIRVGGLLMVAYFGLFAIIYYIYKRKTLKPVFFKTLLWSLGICVAAYILCIFTWPYALEGPVSNVYDAFTNMSKFQIAIKQVFEGRMQWSDNLPLYYSPKFILMTTPIIVLLGFLLSLIFLHYNRKQWFYYMVVLFTALFPICWIVFDRSNVYGGWRHLLFTYPSIVVLAALGLNSLLNLIRNRYARYAVGLAYLLLCINPISHYIRNHPYEYVYFNQFVGSTKDAYGKYEMDYYYHSLREAADWVKQNAKKDSLTTGDKIIVACWHIHPANYYFKDDTAKFQTAFVRWSERGNSDWDYAIVCTTGIEPGTIQNGTYPPKNTVHEIKVDGVPVAIVLKREQKYDWQGFEAMKAKDVNKAKELYAKALAVEPTNETAALGLAEIYLTEARTDSLRADRLPKAAKLLDTFIAANPNHETANYMKAHYYLMNNETDKALAICEKVIFDNYKYEGAYMLAAQAKLQTGDLNGAEDYLTRLLNTGRLSDNLVKTLLQIFKFQGLDDANAYVKLYSLLEQYYLKIGEKKAAAEYTQAIENVMRQQYGRQ